MLDRLLPATRFDCNTLSVVFHTGEDTVLPGGSAFPGKGAGDEAEQEGRGRRSPPLLFRLPAPSQTARPGDQGIVMVPPETVRLPALNVMFDEFR